MVIYSTILTTFVILFLARVSCLFISQYKKQNELKWLLFPTWMKILTCLILPVALVFVFCFFPFSKLEEVIDKAKEDEE